MNNDVWNIPPETPDLFRPHPIIVICEAGDQIEQMYSTEYNVTNERYVNRWCYVDDLIKESENIDKALKIAVDGLEKMTWGCDGSDAEHLLKEIKKITETKGNNNE